jgi:hypothetical protein
LFKRPICELVFRQGRIVSTFFQGQHEFATPKVPPAGQHFPSPLGRLERRDCPSCTVFQKGETLFIVGDKSDNHIDIADTREGGIALSCDGGAAQIFAGVKKWDMKTLAGNGEITATFSAPGDSIFFACPQALQTRPS